MGISQRLEKEVTLLGAPSSDAPQQPVTERRVLNHIEELRAALTSEERTGAEYADFVEALDTLEVLIGDRDEERSIEAFEAERVERLEQNDRLLDLARSADQDGDFTRALRHYGEIVAHDSTGKVRKVLAAEIQSVRKKQSAVEGARELAGDGQHKQAFELLEEAFESASGVMLPFAVRSVPSGAQVRVNGGSPRTTPFNIEGTFEDDWELAYEMPEFEPRAIRVQGPQDVTVFLSRTPKRRYPTDGRIEALPVRRGR